MLEPVINQFKSHIADSIIEVMNRNGLSQTRLVRDYGIKASMPEISHVVNHNFDGRSLEKIIGIADQIGIEVSLEVIS